MTYTHSNLEFWSFVLRWEIVDKIFQSYNNTTLSSLMFQLHKIKFAKFKKNTLLLFFPIFGIFSPCQNRARAPQNMTLCDDDDDRYSLFFNQCNIPYAWKKQYDIKICLFGIHDGCFCSYQISVSFHFRSSSYAYLTTFSWKYMSDTHGSCAAFTTISLYIFLVRNLTLYALSNFRFSHSRSSLFLFFQFTLILHIFIEEKEYIKWRSLVSLSGTRGWWYIKILADNLTRRLSDVKHVKFIGGRKKR